MFSRVGIWICEREENFVEKLMSGMGYRVTYTYACVLHMARVRMGLIGHES